MISQTAPRRSLRWSVKPEDEGFWLDGSNYQDCIRQLKEYGDKHPEKWIYFYDCGVAPGYPIPVARHLLEVSIYDAEPAAVMLFSRLFQKGCDGKREIDTMTVKEKRELTEKQLRFLYMLGSSFCDKKE